jgi:hypothetical protein
MKKEKQKNPRKSDKKIKPKNLRKPETETRKLGKTTDYEMSNGPARVGE